MVYYMENIKLSVGEQEGSGTLGYFKCMSKENERVSISVNFLNYFRVNPSKSFCISAVKTAQYFVSLFDFE